MAYIVGVTGGIASGKTTVTNLFSKQFGIQIIDADLIAREVVAPESFGLKEIKKYFGQQILTTAGSLDRAKLRQIIFNNPEKKKWLDELLHPLIKEKMSQACKQTKGDYALLVIPLLVENNLMYMAQRILVIDVETHTQISRVMQRDNISKAQAEAILSSQASRVQRLSIADDVITNESLTGDFCNLTPSQELQSQVSLLHEKYTKLAKEF